MLRKNDDGSATVTITRSTVERLQGRYEKEERTRAENYTFSKYLNEYIATRLSHEEFISRYMPKYTGIIHENVVNIRDMTGKEPVTAEVVLKNNHLFCRNHKNDHCEHVRFALTIPEIVKLDLDQRSE